MHVRQFLGWNTFTHIWGIEKTVLNLCILQLSQREFWYDSVALSLEKSGFETGVQKWPLNDTTSGIVVAQSMHQSRHTLLLLWWFKTACTNQIRVQYRQSYLQMHVKPWHFLQEKHLGSLLCESEFLVASTKTYHPCIGEYISGQILYYSQTWTKASPPFG